jgi:mono/diheme cytochrome c family protein
VSRAVLTSVIVLAALALGSCGSDGGGKQLDEADRDDAQLVHGADLFRRRCAGCHTLTAAGAQGAATDASSRERRDGPNLDRRKVDHDAALFAIRNGGFGGDRMPANIVQGDDAEAVARFVARYAGRHK